MNKETFCSYPFNTIFLGSDGIVKPCCSSSAKLGDINQQPIEQIINGHLAKHIRQSIIDGKWHDTCGQCKKLEQYGARTERTAVLDKFEEFKDATPDTFILQKLDLRWSNTCNLACNYCYEYFSSQWSTIKGIKVNANKDLAEESLFALIDQNKGTIKDINLLGGEPLLQKQNERLFDALPDKHYYILTNLSLDLTKNKLGQQLINMPDVAWGVSFENINERYEYVRHGAKWDTFLKNGLYLKSLNKEVNAHPLYCAYSALNLVEFYDWLNEVDIFRGVYWCAIQNISGLNVFTWPDTLKKRAIEELDKCIEKYENTKFHESIQSLKEYRKTLIKDVETTSLDAPTQEKHRLDFLQWLSDIENKYLTKTHKFEELWPEIHKLHNYPLV